MDAHLSRNSPTGSERLESAIRPDAEKRTTFRNIAGGVLIAITTLMGTKKALDYHSDNAAASASTPVIMNLEKVEKDQSIVDTWFDKTINTPEGEKEIYYRFNLQNGSLALEIKDMKGKMRRWRLSSKEKTANNKPLDSFVIQDVVFSEGPGEISTMCMYVSPTGCLHVVDDKKLRDAPDALWKTKENTYTMNFEYQFVPHGGLPGAHTIYDLMRNKRAYSGCTIQFERDDENLEQQSSTAHVALND